MCPRTRLTPIYIVANIVNNQTPKPPFLQPWFFASLSLSETTVSVDGLAILEPQFSPTATHQQKTNIYLYHLLHHSNQITILEPAVSLLQP